MEPVEHSGGTRGAPADTGRAHHDLRNQLGIILGFAECLLSGLAPDDPRHRDLEEIHRAATLALEQAQRLFQADAAYEP